MPRTIAIIGAGMAGLSAAARLAAAGHAVTLFDKSRGLGGRMATRRVEGLQFDHGAQYFTAKGKSFRRHIAAWQAAGQAAEWFEGSFVGTPGMTAPARALVGTLPTVTGCTVSALRRETSGWTVLTEKGPVETPGNGAFEIAILAVPAPQAIPLAASAGVALPGIEPVRYAPCWALMLAFDKSVLKQDRIKPENASISWIARNTSKPGRKKDQVKKDPVMGEQETVVVHATPEWSRAHLEESPEQAAAGLLAQFQALTGIKRPPTYVAAHRWRYALVEQALDAPCIWDQAAGFGACGDWCIGARVEAAFDSGEAMARAVLHAQPAGAAV